MAALKITLDPAVWEPLSPALVPGWVDARLSAHWAAQLVAAVGNTHAQRRDDFGHANLGWDRGLGALLGRSVGARHLCAGLRVGALQLLVVLDSSARAQLDLTGVTLGDASRWLASTLQELDPSLAGPLELPTHEMPEHPVAEGGFSAVDAGALRELARWFEDARQLTEAVAAVEARASEPRCWPHHFDLATLIDLGAERSIGVGMSPGDASYPEPYFYVTPWPYPDAARLPELGEGDWHREGWVGAVLQAPSAERAARFVAAATAALSR